MQQVAWSPDGKTFAMAGSIGIWIYDATNLDAAPRILGQDANYFNTIGFSADSHSLIAATYKGIAQIWDLGTGEAKEIAVSGVASAAFSPTGTIVALGMVDGSIQLFDTTTNKTSATLRGHSQPVLTLQFSTDGTLLLSTSRDKTTRLWNLKTKAATVVLTGTGTTNEPHSVLSADGTQIVSVTDKNTVITTDVKTGRTIKTFKLTGGFFVPGVAISPDGTTIAVIDSGALVELVDTQSGQITPFATHSHGEFDSISYSPDGTQIATISFNGEIVVWDSQSFAAQHTFSQSGGGWGLAISQDGQQLIVGNLGNVKLLATDTNEIDNALPDVVSESVALSPDGTQFATTGFQLQTWDTSSFNLVQTFGDTGDETIAAAFSPDGKALAAGSFDGTVRLWNTDTAELIATLKGHTGSIRSIAFSPDGSQLATASTDRSIRLWNLKTNKLSSTLNGHSQSVLSIAYSPDGTKLLSVGVDGKLLRWDVKTGTSTKQLTNLSGYIYTSVAISPDGNLAAVGNSDGDIYIVDEQTNNYVTTLFQHTNLIENLVFSPDGTKLYSTSVDGTLCVWAVQNSPIPQ